MSQYKRNTNNPEIRELENPIDFRSDTVSLPSKEMLQCVEKAKLGVSEFVVSVLMSQSYWWLCLQSPVMF